LCVARLTPVTRATLIEQDPALCELARGNVARAGLRAEVIERDVAEAEGSADLLVSNPPYSAPHAGRASPVEGRDRARRGDVEPFLKACARLLTASGRACFCYPAGSLVALLKAAEGAGMKANRMAFVHPSLDRPARIALVEFGRSGGFALEEAVIG
jgi:Predicted O-methyltransferase